MPPFRYRRRVEFRDTDMAGIVHFSVFFAFMEEAEHELLRSLGLSVFFEDSGRRLSWPRVAADCQYKSAIRFEDEVDVQVSIGKIGTSSIVWNHEFFRGDQKIADGNVTVVCCEMIPGQKPKSVPIPDPIIEKLRQMT